MNTELEQLVADLRMAKAALAVIANHAGRKHPGLADKDNLLHIRSFAHECFCEAGAALRKFDCVMVSNAPSDQRP